ncbi:MAG: TraB/GumN family protein [Treponema sp.]|nr:TraB/GumN family protein [Treponema sp.]
MTDNNLRITFDDREIYIIGTAHVSQESVEEVKNILSVEKPDMVCVELDQGRYNSITQKEQWESLNLSKVFREGKGFLLVANLVLTSFQRRLGKELGVKPGDEMKVAIETAGELGIPYSLCDREVQTTLRRAWAGCGLWSKCKLLASLLASAFTTEKLNAEEIENLKNRNELESLMAELADYLPGVKETLIDERDRYLAAKIWCSIEPDAPAAAETVSPEKLKKRIIAVVGAGHMLGIKAHLEKLASGEETPDVSNLETIPVRSLPAKAAIHLIIPLILVGLLAAGFFRSGAGLSATMFMHWVFWKGSLSALGAIIALAHPLALLVSFVCAPFTAFIPFIGVGVFAGLVQATVYKPRVIDAQNISDDITSLKRVYKNRITRALLVFFLSGLGNSIASFVSISVITGLLVK